MSRTAGPHTADPCPRCFTEAVRPGTPLPAAGPSTVGAVTAVAYACDRCTHTWTRPVEDDLVVHDTVRADLPEATLYGEAWQVEEDRVQVRGPGGALRWVERWRVIIY
ncbi:hypothetical protein ACWEJZ_27180 [Streptomyces bacillaris]|uniref:hypothetical protein n=1 Tax=Streptomyces sp. S8 TaxID=1837283 RepID=UPI000A0934E0|nr:hypothetical protein [Streptomyces sp. S8]ARI53161.1 hypothetical protein A6E92_13850 [Streptomyces sp. S8]